MHPRNQLLGTADLCLQHDKAVPLDTLAYADESGLLLTEFGEPSPNHINYHEGETIHGNTEANFHDL